MLKIAVLASGRGSNLLAILHAIEQGKLHAQVSCVVTDQPEALALENAMKRHIPAVWVNPRLDDGKAGYEKRLLETVLKHEPNCVALAGYMRILGADFIKNMNKLAIPILNIHPSLLPAFPGLKAQAQAIDYGVRFSGCTVHFVDEGVDTGPIIGQAVVPVLPKDDAGTLAERILEEEHRLYPEVLNWLQEGRIQRLGRKVFIK